jgi:hypothetical protein
MTIANFTKSLRCHTWNQNAAVERVGHLSNRALTRLQPRKLG